MYRQPVFIAELTIDFENLRIPKSGTCDQQFPELKSNLSFHFRLIVKMPSKLQFSKEIILEICRFKACGCCHYLWKL